MRDHTGAELAADPDPFGADGAVARTGPGGAAAWVYAADASDAVLGRALAWSTQQPAVHELHIVVDDAVVAGVVARRAGYFAPAPTVWVVAGRVLAPAAPTARPAVPPLSAAVAALADVILAAGADALVEHGELIAEVAGLEVARGVVDEQGAHLEVGVGKHDREATAMLHGDLTASASLARVIEIVRQHRRPGAEPHPLNRLAPERWLRARIVADPALVGADQLAPMPPPVRPPGLRLPFPAFAAGIDQVGAPIVVACSVGVDLNVVPLAADARDADGRAARLLIAVPPRDCIPALDAVAALLAAPADAIAVPC